MRFSFFRKKGPSFSRRRRFEQSQTPEANPYFQRTTTRGGEEQFSSSRAFVLAGLFVIIVGLFYLFSYARSFELTLSIEGVRRTDQAFLTQEAHAVLQTRMWGMFKRNKYTTISNKYFRDAFLARMSGKIAFDHVDVKKRFPDKLTVTVFEREPELTWTTAGSTYLLDAEGVIVQKAPVLPDGTQDAELAAKPHIEDANNFPVEIGEQAIIPQTPQAVLTMDAKLKEFGLAPTAYSIPEVSCEILLPEKPPVDAKEQTTSANSTVSVNINAVASNANSTTNTDATNGNANGNVNATPPCDRKALARNTRTIYASTDQFQIRFAADHLDVQIAKLQRLLQDKFFDGKNLSYIDIRFGERVYYK